jgi:hypothetical protein
MNVGPTERMISPTSSFWVRSSHTTLAVNVPAPGSMNWTDGR